MVNSMDRMLSVPEVAKMLHVHPNTLRRWSDDGLITSYRITTRGDRRYFSDDVKEFLKKMNHNNSMLNLIVDQGRAHS